MKGQWLYTGPTHGILRGMALEMGDVTMLVIGVDYIAYRLCVVPYTRWNRVRFWCTEHWRAFMDRA